VMQESILGNDKLKLIGHRRNLRIKDLFLT